MRNAFLTTAFAGLAAVNAIPTISVKGSKFFTSEGDQFFVKGALHYASQLGGCGLTTV
jgi:hypothetical protein